MESIVCIRTASSSTHFALNAKPLHQTTTDKPGAQWRSLRPARLFTHRAILKSMTHDEIQDLRVSGYKPVITGPSPFSLETVLRFIDPAPDAETEAFVAAIYADRTPSSASSHE